MENKTPLTLSELSWMDPKQLFKFYGISVERQNKLRSKKLIPYSKFGNYIRYEKAQIEKWLRSHAQKATAENHRVS